MPSWRIRCTPQLKVSMSATLASWWSLGDREQLGQASRQAAVYLNKHKRIRSLPHGAGCERFLQEPRRGADALVPDVIRISTAESLCPGERVGDSGQQWDRDGAGPSSPFQPHGYCCCQNHLLQGTKGNAAAQRTSGINTVRRGCIRTFGLSKCSTLCTV